MKRDLNLYQDILCIFAREEIWALNADQVHERLTKNPTRYEDLKPDETSYHIHLAITAGTLIRRDEPPNGFPSLKQTYMLTWQGHEYLTKFGYE